MQPTAIYTMDFKPYPEQKEIMLDKHRYRIVDMGRRGGKTKMAAASALEMSTPGAMGWIVVPKYPLIHEIWDSLLDLIPSELIKRKSETERYIKLANNAQIECKSADSGDETLRSRGLDWAIMEEAARIPRNAWLKGVRPALSDKKGRAMFISTPKGRELFFDLWVKGQSDDYPDYKSWKYESRVNPYFPADEWEIAKKELPADIFAQEFCADFLADEASALKNVDNCIKGDVLDINFEENIIRDRNYVMGVDLAKHQDFTVITVFDMVTRHLVGFDRFKDKPWGDVKHRIRMMAKIFHNPMIIIDSTGVGDPIYDDLQREGFRIKGYAFTNASKNSLINELQINLEMQKISFPEKEVLINELKAFEYEITEGGRLRYNAPEGLHDDCVISVALAVHGLGLNVTRKNVLTDNRQFRQFKKDRIPIPAHIDHSGVHKGIPA